MSILLPILKFKEYLTPFLRFDSFNWREHKNQMVSLRDDMDHFIGLCYKIFSVILPLPTSALNILRKTIEGY